MKFDFVSRAVIKPSKPTPDALREYKFSFFDQLAAPAYPGFIFFYPNHHQDDYAKRCEQLEKSLSHTLSFFYMLAGTFVPGQFLVICDDRGVEVTKTRVHGDLVDIIDQGYMPNGSNLVHSLVPCVTRLAKSVFAVQMSLFSCGGFGLGFRILHSISDGFSVSTFLNHWSTTNRLGVNHSCFVPSFKLASIFARREELVGVKPQLNPPTPRGKLVRKLFLLNSSRIAGLKMEACGGKLKPTRQQPSKVLVVTAHIWRTLIRLRQTQHGYVKPSLMSFAMDLRSKILSLNLPQYSWGTFISNPSARFTGDENKMGLSELVDLLNGGIKREIEEFSAARNWDGFYSKMVKQYNETRGDHNPLQEDLCGVTSWCGFSLYDAVDFGWEKPCRFFLAPSKPLQVFLLLDTKEGDGIEIWATLFEEEMEHFERHFLENDDKEFSAATTSSKL